MPVSNHELRFSRKPHPLRPILPVSATSPSSCRCHSSIGSSEQRLLVSPGLDRLNLHVQDLDLRRRADFSCASTSARTLLLRASLCLHSTRSRFSDVASVCIDSHGKPWEAGVSPLGVCKESTKGRSPLRVDPPRGSSSARSVS
jgi:hypothetical protein